jgi:hypothetical protein
MAPAATAAETTAVAASCTLGLEVREDIVELIGWMCFDQYAEETNVSVSNI